jgi:aminopeptidase N
VDRGELPNQLQRAVIAGFAATTDSALLTPYRDRYFEALPTVWEARSPEMAKQIVLGLFPTDGRAAVEAAGAWLERHPAAPPALRRLVLEQYDDARRALLAQATDRRRRADDNGERF